MSDTAAGLPAREETAQLSREEIDEYRQLRRDRAARQAAERAERQAAEARLTPATHHVRLADGQVADMPGGTIPTHHTYGDGTGRRAADRIVRVAGAHEI